MDQLAAFEVDVVVVGGGLQGLFVLKELLKRNYSAVLLAKGALGDGQTSHSHAFLHEGHMFRDVLPIKQAQLSYEEWAAYLDKPAALAWEGDFYFADTGLIDLNAFVTVWEKAGLSTSSARNAPTYFNPDMAFWVGHGRCLNTTELVERMASDYEEYIASVSHCQIDAGPERVVIEALNSRGESIRIEARSVVAAAGVGNDDILSACAVAGPQQQTIRAHMLVVRSTGLPPIAGYFRPLRQNKAVFIAPRILDGSTVWLISDGNRGVMAPTTPNKYEWDASLTREWLKQLLQSMTQLCGDHFDPAKRGLLDWAVYRASKAELETKGRRMPEGGQMPMGPEVRYIAEKRICVVWPTLLTHIPRASRMIFESPDWFVTPSGAPALPVRSMWHQWKCRPEVAVELWRTIPFQTWEDFKSCHGLA